MIEWDKIQISLETGDLAILPTETVYGLATHAYSQEGIDRIYEAKGRSFDKPLAIVVRNQAEGEKLAEFNDLARTLAVKYWPGPLTLVLNAKENPHLDPRTLGEADGKKTIALRCPDTDWREKLEGPLALTSANPSGEEDITSVDDMGSIPDSFLNMLYGCMKTEGQMSGKATTIIRVVDENIILLRQGELEISS